MVVQMTEQNYSVLMSVYSREKAEYLQKSIEHAFTDNTAE